MTIGSQLKTLKHYYAEWFKINLTLFKSHISHKWEHIVDSSRYLQSVIPWEDVVKIDVEIMKWEAFSDKYMVENHFTPTQSVWSLVGSIVLYFGIIKHITQSIIEVSLHDAV